MGKILSTLFNGWVFFAGVTIFIAGYYRINMLFKYGGLDYYTTHFSRVGLLYMVLSFILISTLLGYNLVMRILEKKK